MRTERTIHGYLGMNKIVRIEPNKEYGRGYPIHKRDTGEYTKRELLSAIKRTLKFAKKILPPKTIFEIKAKRSEKFTFSRICDDGSELPRWPLIAWYCRKTLPRYLTDRIIFNETEGNVFCGRFRT